MELLQAVLPGTVVGDSNSQAGYNLTIVLPAELAAAAVLISYWDNTTHPGVYIAVTLVVAGQLPLSEPQ